MADLTLVHGSGSTFNVQRSPASSGSCRNSHISVYLGMLRLAPPNPLVSPGKVRGWYCGWTWTIHGCDGRALVIRCFRIHSEARSCSIPWRVRLGGRHPDPRLERMSSQAVCARAAVLIAPRGATSVPLLSRKIRGACAGAVVLCEAVRCERVGSLHPRRYMMSGANFIPCIVR